MRAGVDSLMIDYRNQTEGQGEEEQEEEYRKTSRERGQRAGMERARRYVQPPGPDDAAPLHTPAPLRAQVSCYVVALCH